MTKKMKVRVSALVMCAAMLVISGSVWAFDEVVSTTEYVALDSSTSGKTYLELSTVGMRAKATTGGVSLYNDIIYTHITGYGTAPRENTGWSTVDVEPIDAPFSSATSVHKWTSRTHTLTVYR